MAIPHAQPGTLIDVRPLGSSLPGAQTTTLAKAEDLEVIRLVMPAGREIKTHTAPGPMTLQCLEGRVAFTTMGKTLDLSSGQLLHLAAGEAHALQAIEDSSLLLTLVLKQQS
jgi:quercetin dioxygenase-like cupin family protein